MINKILLIAVLALSLIACESPTSTLNPNKRPETTMWADSIINDQSSIVHLYWRGDDADGMVVGFIQSWDGKDWFFTRKTDSTFTIKLQSNKDIRKFQISAIDNNLDKYPKEGDKVVFADNNGDNIYSDGDYFAELNDAYDLSPAKLFVPMVNTPPALFWGVDSTKAAAQIAELPDTTFAVATFLFSAYDLDGEETIEYYEWSLNDSSSGAKWTRLNKNEKFFTLYEKDGLILNSDNKLYIRGFDNGGMQSKVLAYPSENKTWYVKKQKGDILVVRDYSINDATNDFYVSALNSVASGKFANKFDVLDIKLGLTPTTKAKNLPPFLKPNFIEILKLFKAVIWYSDNSPSALVAQETVPDYQKSGGKIFFNGLLPSPIDETTKNALVDYLPIDSTSAEKLFSDLSSFPKGSIITSNKTLSVQYPDLIKEKGVAALGVYVQYPKVTAQALYYLSEGSAWSGTPCIGAISGDHKTLFLNMPLHLMNQNKTAETFLEKLLIEEFGL